MSDIAEVRSCLANFNRIRINANAQPQCRQWNDDATKFRDNDDPNVLSPWRFTPRSWLVEYSKSGQYRIVQLMNRSGDTKPVTEYMTPGSLKRVISGVVLGYSEAWGIPFWELVESGEEVTS